jgi:hypothetical protein
MAQTSKLTKFVAARNFPFIELANLPAQSSISDRCLNSYFESTRHLGLSETKCPLTTCIWDVSEYPYNFRGFPLSLNTNSGLGCTIRPGSLPSKPFPIHLDPHQTFIKLDDAEEKHNFRKRQR